MRLLLRNFLAIWLFAATARIGWAQAPVDTSDPPPIPRAGRSEIAADSVPHLTASNPGKEFEARQAELEQLRLQAATVRAALADDDQKKQIELLQKQVETLEKQIKLLNEQIKKPSPDVEKLQLQAATLEARSLQAARRDQELASSVDDLREHVDSEERYGPRLPWQVKEMFLPGGNNETPLSIYGALSFGYSKIIGDSISAANGAGRPSTPGGFYFGEFTPDFLLKLNDWIFLEAELGIGSDGSVSAGSFAQADFFVNDWLTIIAGRFVAPIGWYNERINNPWINKLPADAPGSAPLLWLQVLPPFSMLGVQATGSFYLGCSPFKLEYAAYVTNGLNFTPAAAGAPTINELANIENMQDTFTFVSNQPAFGGRIGLWWPEAGLEAGISGMSNGDYVAGGFEDAITLWAVDFNFHKGNWDLRAEYGMSFQQTGSFAGTPGLDGTHIRRQGFYGQVAYRPRDLPNTILQNVEVVYRYSYVDFQGIDPTALDLSTFSTPVDVPVRRQQNEFGVNYWFTPRLVVKAAYQINDEPNFHLHDNQFLAELDWGW
jgi:hypothetical protein